MKKFIYAALLALGVLALMAPPAMAQEEKPFTIHGEVRYRGEYTNNASDLDDNLVANNDGGNFFPYRVRIAAEGHFAHNVSAWIEFQNASVGGNAGFFATNPFRTGGADDNSSVQLYQGNVTFDQLWSKNFSLRIGRQELVAGNELLLGDLDFYTGISHDGAVGNWKIKKVNVMVWYTRPLEDNVNIAANPGSISPGDVAIIGPNFDVDFAGGYATWTWKKDNLFDVYLMDLTDHKATGQSIQTIGVRWSRDVVAKNGFFWDAEIAQQFGQFSDTATKVDAEGRAIEGWFGYNWKKGKNSHRVYGRLELATGDKTSTADKNEGFVPMFGDFHNRTGHGDWFQLQNATTGLGTFGATGGLKAVSVAYTGVFNDKHEFGVAWWDYKTEQKPAGFAFGDKLGTAYDVWYGYNYSRNVNFSASLSQLSPDDALTHGGSDDKVTRLYGQARLRF